ncbi:MAG: hypothetical protein JSS76_19485 [Bacteroidetes bacterium]|nr:hypothetical protein [Bacteroidota bacterium]
MSAAIGNTYAEKWTLERTRLALDLIDRYSRNDPDMLYIGQALESVGTHQDTWKYWRRKWHKQYEVIDFMKMLLQRFENRIFARMAKKEIPERVGMFALRHHYGWCEDRSGQVEDISYVDREPVRQPQAPDEAAPAPADLPREEPPAPAQKPATDKAMTLTPRRVSDENAASLRASYNLRHPEAPLTVAYPFYLGTPPAGAAVVRYGEGYFLME